MELFWSTTTILCAAYFDYVILNTTDKFDILLTRKQQF